MANNFVEVPLMVGGDAVAHARERRVVLPVSRGLGKAHAAGALAALPWEVLPNGGPTLPLCVIEAVYAPLMRAENAVLALPAAACEIGIAKLDAIDAFVDADSGIDFANVGTTSQFLDNIRVLVGMLRTGEWDDPGDVLLIGNGDIAACDGADPNVVADATGTMVDSITFGDLSSDGRLRGFALLARLGGNRKVAPARRAGGAVHSVVAMAAHFALGANPTMPDFMQRHIAISWLLENEARTRSPPTTAPLIGSSYAAPPVG